MSAHAAGGNGAYYGQASQQYQRPPSYDEEQQRYSQRSSGGQYPQRGMSNTGAGAQGSASGSFAQAQRFASAAESPMSSPAFMPKRYRHPTADGASAALPTGHEGDASDNSDKYWDAPPPPLPINGGGMYQQSNVSAPQVDVSGGQGSRGPPLADDLGFDKLSIAARSKSPAAGSIGGRGMAGASAAVERANAAYATQEIFQSAAEVPPDSSLKAIAAEVDQTAADINSDALMQQHYQQGGNNALPNTTSPPSMQGNFDPASQQAYAGHHAGYDPALYSQGSMQGGWYGTDGQYYDDGQQQQQQQQYNAYAAYPAHHQQSGGYFTGAHAGVNDGMAGSSSSHMGGYGAGATPGYPYTAAAQGYGLEYPGSAGGNSQFSGYGAPDPVGRNASVGGGSYMPGLNRQGTQMSMASAQSSSSAAGRRRSSKDAGIKAAQQSLPFNKSFVEEYRQRMKKDPDPEAQFAFARYLIEAAKKINDPKDGPKQARKYRDNLLGESLKLIKRLATTGMGLGKPPYAEAQFFLANCFGNGSLGLQVDHEKAYNLYVQASKQNHAAATYRTAVCNEVGAGTRRDHHRAVLFYRKASALGDTAGMYKLGMILLNGLLGQPRNIREAVVWLKRAAGQADEDNPHALHELGLLYEKANNNIVPLDEGYARELFTQAAQLGYAPSQFKLGSAYEYGTLTCPVDPRRSIAWYTKAAGKHDGESELALSGWYLTGSEGVLKQSDSEAYLWARRAATKGIPKAEYAVGYYSEVGIGVESNIEEAKRWYMRAAAQGNKRAMMRLTELKQQKDGRMGRKGARPTRKDAESECVIA